MCDYFVEIYKKFDGSTHPELSHDKLKELQSKEDSQRSKEATQQVWWKKYIPGAEAIAKFIKNRGTSSDESEMKWLPIVKTYLASYCKFITGEINLNLNPLEVIDKIVYMIESLMKCSFYVEGNNRCLLASDIKKV